MGDGAAEAGEGLTADVAPAGEVGQGRGRGGGSGGGGRLRARGAGVALDVLFRDTAGGACAGDAADVDADLAGELAHGGGGEDGALGDVLGGRHCALLVGEGFRGNGGRGG